MKSHTAIEKIHGSIPAVLVLLLVSVALPAFGARGGLPVEDGKQIVARVEGETITLEAFEAAVAAAKRVAAREALESGAADANEGAEDSADGEISQEVLSRLVNRKLILQEAGRIGLSELPDVVNLVDVYKKIELRKALLRERVESLEVSDEEIEPFYQAAIRRPVIASVIFADGELAEKARQKIEAGAAFEDEAASALEDGTAKGSIDASPTDMKELLPAIARTLSETQVGDTSSVVNTPNGFVLMKFVSIVSPDDPEARGPAKELARRKKQTDTLNGYLVDLRAKHARVNDQLLEELDFEAEEPGFEALREDPRVIAEFDGQDPITVADLAEDLRQEFYHGIGQAIESKKVNTKKVNLFDERLRKIVMAKEAVLRGVHESAVYLDSVRRYEDAVVFGAFVQKVAQPDVKVGEKEVAEYYADHIEDYSTPEMIKTNCIAFPEADLAKAAMGSLAKGSEFSWLKVNADGQVARGTPGLLDCEGKLVTTADLPEDVQEALTGAKVGDYREYTAAKDRHYIFHVERVISASPQPLEDAKKEVVQAVFDAKLETVIDDWARQLEEASEVDIYWTAED